MVSPLNDLMKERMWRLEHKEEAYQRITQDPLQQTAIKFFPFTRAWYVGGVQGNSLSFECVLAEIGEKHGIIVISDSKHPDFLAGENTLELVQNRQRTFPQDFLDFNSQEICFPAVIDSNPVFTTLSVTRERSLRKKVFEDEASRQLQEKGFKIIRYPGRFEVYFPKTPEPAPLMNFFNMVTANTPGGKNLIISMGCPDLSCGYNFNALFFEMLRSGGVSPDQIEIIFLDFKDSQESLMFNGGISCRVKTMASFPSESMDD